MNNFECADSPHCPAPMTCPFARICGKYQEALRDEDYERGLDIWFSVHDSIPNDTDILRWGQEWRDVQETQDWFRINAREG